MDPLISPKAIEEFRAAWRVEFGQELSPEQAGIEAESLVRTVHMIFLAAARIEKAAEVDSNEIRLISNQMLPTEHREPS
jgi:hypothetical protein